MKRAILPLTVLLFISTLVFAAIQQTEAQKEQDLKDLINAGRAYTLSKDYDKAIKMFRRAVNLHPSSAEAHDGLGQAYVAVGRNTDAVEVLKKAI